MIGYPKLYSQKENLNSNRSFNENAIYSIVDSTCWDFASKNEDDDFHTDVVFLKVTCDAIREEIGDCHDKTFLMYKGYCGEFYFTKQNTKRLCDKIIAKLKVEDAWRKDFNHNIYVTADGLFNTFDGFKTHDLNSLNTKQLSTLYQKQYNAQIELYKKCWIAEVIQVPKVGLTDYLVNYIKSFNVSDDVAEKFFYDLTRSAKDSVYVEEEKKIIQLAEKILLDTQLMALFQKELKYLRTYVPTWVYTDITLIEKRYSYLAYHGFGNRQPHSKDDYLIRIRNYILHPETIAKEKNKWERNSEKTHSTLQTLLNLMDCVHLELFEMYAELAVSKAYRRLAQLKNFYYLDKLLNVIANRFNIPESYLRFMLPEEVILLLENQLDQLDFNHIKSRTNEMVYMVSDGTEFIFINDMAKRLRTKIEKSEEEPIPTTLLTGRSACMGLCKGTAVVVERNKDVTNFNYGNILVSLEADPDLIPIMKMAGAIVTDQGGITCHAAVIAREFNIPCVIGTINATKLIQTGDILFVDATKGEVTIENQTT